jgi:hypothetical protein
MNHVLQNSDYSVKYSHTILVPLPYYPSCVLCFQGGLYFYCYGFDAQRSLPSNVSESACPIPAYLTFLMPTSPVSAIPHTECLDRRFRREGPPNEWHRLAERALDSPERVTQSFPISVKFTPPLSTSNMNRLGLDLSTTLTLTIRHLRPWPLTLPESISSHTLFARAGVCARAALACPAGGAYTTIVAVFVVDEHGQLAPLHAGTFSDSTRSYSSSRASTVQSWGPISLGIPQTTSRSLARVDRRRPLGFSEYAHGKSSGVFRSRPPCV